MIAGDTRQSEGYSIQSRYAPKVTQLTEHACIAVNGFAADGKELVKQIKQRLQVSFSFLIGSHPINFPEMIC